MPTRAIEAANLEVELLPPHILSHRLKRVCRTAYDLEIAMAEVLELRARVKAAETRFAERNRQGAVNALHATPRASSLTTSARSLQPRGTKPTRSPPASYVLCAPTRDGARRS